MRNNIMTIIKKELKRFFGDKRLLFTTVLMPGLLIYLVYTLMGDGMMNQFTTAEDYKAVVQVTNLPKGFEEPLEKEGFVLDEVSAEEQKQAKERVEKQELDLYVAFPEQFEQQVQEYDAQKSEGAAPNVEIFYNSARVESQGAYQALAAFLDSYEASMANKLDINNSDTQYDLASEEDTTGRFLSMILPVLLMTFLYSGSVAVAPESIAGEKERGTIATLLVTPMKRSHLALGKIISLSFIALLSGCSSFIGIMLSMPKMMAATGSVNTAVYQVKDYVMLLLVVLSTVLLMVAAISIISALSKSVKEAGTAVAPLMILIMVVSISTFVSSEAVKSTVFYLIPFYNSAQVFGGIFSFTVLQTNVIVTVLANLVYSLLLAGVLTKLFDSEKIMYI